MSAAAKASSERPSIEEVRARLSAGRSPEQAAEQRRGYLLLNGSLLLANASHLLRDDLSLMRLVWGALTLAFAVGTVFGYRSIRPGPIHASERYLAWTVRTSQPCRQCGTFIVPPVDGRRCPSCGVINRYGDPKLFLVAIGIGLLLVAALCLQAGLL
jgi:hypothetical protein